MEKQITMNRKPFNLKEVRKSPYGFRERVLIEKEVEISTTDYDKMVSNFFNTLPFIDQMGIKGTWTDDIHPCILVVAPDRRKLAIDTQGFNYARYVGVWSN